MSGRRGGGKWRVGAWARVDWPGYWLHGRRVAIAGFGDWRGIGLVFVAERAGAATFGVLAENLVPCGAPVRQTRGERVRGELARGEVARAGKAQAEWSF